MVWLYFDLYLFLVCGLGSGLLGFMLWCIAELMSVKKMDAGIYVAKHTHMECIMLKMISRPNSPNELRSRSSSRLILTNCYFVVSECHYFRGKTITIYN